MRNRTLIALAAFGCIAFCGAGCNREKGAKITGVLVENGQTLRVTEKEFVLLGFVPTQKDQESIKANPGAEFNRQDASFVFIGPGLGLVPPGDYKITLMTRSRETGDRFGGQFKEENTPLSYTVTDEPKQEIVIDVAKKIVTRK